MISYSRLGGLLLIFMSFCWIGCGIFLLVVLFNWGLEWHVVDAILNQRGVIALIAAFFLATGSLFLMDLMARFSYASKAIPIYTPANTSADLSLIQEILQSAASAALPLKQPTLNLIQKRNQLTIHAATSNLTEEEIQQLKAALTQALKNLSLSLPVNLKLT